MNLLFQFGLIDKLQVCVCPLVSLHSLDEGFRVCIPSYCWISIKYNVKAIIWSSTRTNAYMWCDINTYKFRNWEISEYDFLCQWSNVITWCSCRTRPPDGHPLIFNCGLLENFIWSIARNAFSYFLGKNELIKKYYP